MEIVLMAYGHPLWEKTMAFAEQCSWKAGPYLAKMMRNHEFREPERVVAATEENEIVGFCTFSRKDELPEDCEYTPFIGFVFVDEGSRGKGISEKMIAAAADHAKAIGYDAIYLMSGEQGLYEKYGFEKIGDYQTIFGTVDQLFQKRLA